MTAYFWTVYEIIINVSEAGSICNSIMRYRNKHFEAELE